MRIKIIAKPSGDKLPEEVKDDLLGLEFESVARRVKKNLYFAIPRKDLNIATVGYVVESITVAETLIEFGKEQSAIWWCGEILQRNDFWTFDKECCEIVSD